jgi:hypothetical protein
MTAKNEMGEFFFTLKEDILKLLFSIKYFFSIIVASLLIPAFLENHCILKISCLIVRE